MSESLHLDSIGSVSALPLQHEILHRHSLSVLQPYTSSGDLDNIFPPTPMAPMSSILDPYRQSLSHHPQAYTHERNGSNNGPNIPHRQNLLNHGSPVPSTVSQDQSLLTASTPSSPHQSRSSSFSGVRPTIRPNTGSPMSQKASASRTFSVTSQPTDAFLMAEGIFTKPTSIAMQHFQQQQQQQQQQKQQQQHEQEKEQEYQQRQWEEYYRIDQQHKGDEVQNQQNRSLEASAKSKQELQPLHVVGRQGIRRVLPSAGGRMSLSPGKSQQVPTRDENGKYPCLHCQKTYLHAKHLKRHLLRHTGDRPYECYLCKDNFSRSDILKRHFQKCSQRRGNPLKLDHLAARRKNRSFSTADASWRSSRRPANDSVDLTFNSPDRLAGSSSLATEFNGGSVKTPRSSPSSLSDGTARFSNSYANGRSKSSVELLSQYQQHQPQGHAEHDPGRGGRSGSRTVSRNGNIPVPSASASVTEALAAYSMPQHQIHGNGAIEQAYGLGIPLAKDDEWKDLNETHAYSGYLNGQGSLGRQFYGLQDVVEAQIPIGPGPSYDISIDVGVEGMQPKAIAQTESLSDAQQRQGQQLQGCIHNGMVKARPSLSDSGTVGFASTASPSAPSLAYSSSTSPNTSSIPPTSTTFSTEAPSDWRSASSLSCASNGDSLLTPHFQQQRSYSPRQYEQKQYQHYQYQLH